MLKAFAFGLYPGVDDPSIEQSGMQKKKKHEQQSMKSRLYIGCARALLGLFLHAGQMRWK